MRRPEDKAVDAKLAARSDALSNATRFGGRLAVITGATGGIGLTTARRLAADGARLFLVDRDKHDVTRAVATLGGEGIAVSGIEADVRLAADVERYAAAAADFGGARIDMFFNNAGIEGPAGPVTELSDDAFDDVMAVNVRGVYLGLKHVIPWMQDGGAIVNTASMGGLFGTANLSAYIASKHAVLGLTRSVAKEVATQGIRVNAVCPGPVAGRMNDVIQDALQGHGVEREIPIGRFARAEEIAAVVAFLLSDDASYICGASYQVDGGRRA
jgi:NAD(P)-dependent dehydrogenase (short-subunit alcohol dehydrogenase family)